MISVEVHSNNVLTVRDNTFSNAVSDSVKHETVKFLYSDNWKNYQKTAVFSAEGVEPVNILLSNENDLCVSEDECYIPFEVLKGDSFMLSVFGVDGDRLATTPRIAIEVLASGYALGDLPQEPTESEYDQIINIMVKTQQIAQSVRDDADKGLFKGERGEKGADGTMSFNDLTEEQKASLKGEKGADGTMVFEDLTEEQKASLKGDKGDTGPQGVPGIQGPKGDDGADGEDYILTDADKRAIAKLVETDANNLNLSIAAPAITKTTSGGVKSITVNDVSALPHDCSCRITSDTYTFTDKNLYEVTNATLGVSAYNGETIDPSFQYEINDNGSITLNGCTNVAANLVFKFYNLEAGKTYTFSLKSGNLLQFSNQREYVIVPMDENGNMGDTDAYFVSDSGEKITFTVTEDFPNVMAHVDVGSAQVYNNLTLYPQLELGTEATEWSANTSKNKYKTTDDTFQMVNPSDSASSPSFNYNVNDNGTITLNGYTDIDLYTRFKFYNLEVGKTYTFSLKSSDASQFNSDQVYATIIPLDENGNIAENGSYWTEALISNVTFTVTESNPNVGVDVAISRFDTSDNPDLEFIPPYDNLILYPQLELGEVASAWTPYSEVGMSRAYVEDLSTVKVKIGNSTYTPDAYGIITEIASVAPTMQITTDNAFINIHDFTYHADTKKYIDSNSGGTGGSCIDEIYIQNGNLYVKKTTDSTAVNLGTVKGSKGDKGDKGDKGEAGAVKFIPVTQLPTENIDTDAIYLVPSTNSEENNIYNEYMYTNDNWERIGSAGVELNLDDYVKKTDYATSDVAGLVKTSRSQGLGLADGRLFVDCATKAEMDTKTNYRNPIVPSVLDYAVKVGLTTNTETLTDEEKAVACDWLGTVTRKPSVDAGWRRLYGIDASGNETIFRISEDTAIYSIPARGVGGAVTVGTPTKDTHATNKAYVDTAIGDIESTLESIIEIQNALISDKVEAMLIRFTINGTTYLAEKGMTWGEWCESVYNTCNCYLVDDGGINIVYTSDGKMLLHDALYGTVADFEVITNEDVYGTMSD